MKVFLQSIQWLLFILIGSLVTPISIGEAFDLPQTEVAQLLQRTFFIIGVSCLLHIIAGHRLPILEGPAGLWWGVFLAFSGMTAMYSEHELLRQLEMAMFLCGGMFILFSMLGLIEKVKSLFTPLVTGTYLVLLVFQLSGSFVKGMLGIGYMEDAVSLKVAAASLLTLIINIWLSKSKRPLLNMYSLLLSLLFGWGTFAALGLLKIGEKPGEVIAFPKWFSWGIPQFNPSIILVSIMTAFLLMINLIASIKVVEEAVQRPQQNVYRAAGAVTGFTQILAGMFSSIGAISNSHTAGFIAITGMKARLPFITASLLLIFISCFPLLSYMFSLIPSPVGYAVVFFAFVNLLRSGINQLKEPIRHEWRAVILCLSLMAGVGVFTVPAQALASIPVFLLPLFNNGMITGVLTCIVLEQAGIRKRKC
ncbi:MAG TPA: purine/pyrimidine permease [Bacillus sp. (in: firmicutes)]|nr:purine/pyrimidine permease [Bacillus sp. (in: firmicutes)]